MAATSFNIDRRFAKLYETRVLRSEADMFEKDEVLRELHGRLVSAGINPLDPKVQTICTVVNAFYAEKTSDVLRKMQEVLNKIAP
jgi:hypothetical protein